MEKCFVWNGRDSADSAETHESLGRYPRVFFKNVAWSCQKRYLGIWRDDIQAFESDAEMPEKWYA